ncbi:M1 family metallopeptidase [Chitinophaga polysaccharea]|uniref:M1 family metallopeptidase n=1 Tax=Chitinophaga TaxID=79328 RepID=UPI001455CC0D|nr:MULTISPECIES: M1 family metallopeptidase [Chitinophaga]NLR57582.1 M1 family metallopeptidase [Chitinophaga polysaccharea]NLU95496.1 M1 family metallopeptidase [Chitinophaga sp. Ak27]
MYFKFSILLVGVFQLFQPAGAAQSGKDTTYNPAEAFAPLNYPPGNDIRTADGKPGGHYWQNKADYRLVVTFDTATRTVQGTVNITYANNSPVTLDYVWLQATQNRFRKDPRMSMITKAGVARFDVEEYTDGCRIHAMQAANDKQSLRKTSYEEAGNYIKVQLPAPLLPGHSAVIAVAYDFVLPVIGSDYMGILSTPHGKVYQFSGMFPRVCVYDAVQGWNVAGSGYFVEPGNLDVSITVPAGLIVQGTGQLMNPEAVLSPGVLERYKKAWKSDSVIHIRTETDLRSSVAANKQQTWHFYTPNAGDGLWGVSEAFLWDAVRVNLPDGRTTLAMALYPPESNPDWRKITGQMKDIIRLYSHNWVPYPYTTAVNIAGSITGVAGPAVSVLHYSNSSFGNTVWTKTNHEIGHTWFNMMIAADSKHGWMCEGLNTFINLVNCDSLKGEPAFDVNTAIGWLSTPKALTTLNTPASSVKLEDMAMVMYVKPAVALWVLRNEVIGKQRFDQAFRCFVKDWAFKHPTPDDFFRSIENGTGTDLSWFWRSWFLTDWKSNPAIRQVEYVKGDPALGIDVTIEIKRNMPMPLTVEIREFNGTVNRQHLPIDIWQQKGTYTFHYASVSPVTTVILDPANAIPDLDRSNNTWKGTGLKTPVTTGVTAAQVVNRYLSAIGGKAALQQLQQATINYASNENAQLDFKKQWQPGTTQTTISLNMIHMQLANISTTDTSVQFTRLGQAVPLSVAQRAQLNSNASLFPELHFFDKGYQAILDDALVNVNGMNAYVVHVIAPGGSCWDYYYDVTSGYKIKECAPVSTAGGLLYDRLEFAGYQPQYGIQWPATLLYNVPGEGESLLQLKKVTVQ